MSSPLRFALVGSGNVALLHARALEGVADARLAVVAGRNPETTRALAARCGVEACDVETAFTRADVDAVIIGTPSGTHADLGTQAALAGKHVLVEKPIDVTLARAQALVDACRVANVRLGVILQNRFLPEVALLRRAVARGRLGRILVADGFVKWYRAPTYYTQAPWRGTKALDGGGALINQAIHTADLLLHLVGDVERVQSIVRRQRHADIESEDTALALLEYTGGACGVLEASTALRPGWSRKIELHGAAGSVALEGNAITTWQVDGHGDEEVELERLRGARVATSGGAADPMDVDVAPHRAQIQDFVQAVRASRPPLVDGVEGTRALALVLAIYRAAETGQAMAVEPR